MIMEKHRIKGKLLKAGDMVLLNPSITKLAGIIPYGFCSPMIVGATKVNALGGIEVLSIDYNTGTQNSHIYGVVKFKNPGMSRDDFKCYIDTWSWGTHMIKEIVIIDMKEKIKTLEI